MGRKKTRRTLKLLEYFYLYHKYRYKQLYKLSNVCTKEDTMGHSESKDSIKHSFGLYAETDIRKQWKQSNNGALITEKIV